MLYYSHSEDTSRFIRSTMLDFTFTSLSIIISTILSIFAALPVTLYTVYIPYSGINLEGHMFAACSKHWSASMYFFLIYKG